MVSRSSLIKRRNRTLTAKRTSLSEIYQRTLTKRNLWNFSKSTVKLDLVNSKSLLTIRAEVLVMFNSLSKRVLKKLLLASMTLLLEKTLFQLQYTQRKMREKLKVRNSPTCSLETCQVTTPRSSFKAFSKSMEKSTQSQWTKLKLVKVSLVSRITKLPKKLWKTLT